MRYRETYRLAAFAVSITLPPPTLSQCVNTARVPQVRSDARKEVAAVLLSGPGDGVSPTGLRRFRNDTVVHDEGQVLLGLEGGDGLIRDVSESVAAERVGERRTIFAGGSFATFGSVKTAT